MTVNGENGGDGNENTAKEMDGKMVQFRIRFRQAMLIVILPVFC